MVVECASLRVDFSETILLIQRLNRDVGKALSGVSTEVRKPYEDIVDAVELKFKRTSSKRR